MCYFCCATKVTKNAVKGDPFDGSPLTIPTTNDREGELRLPLLELPQREYYTAKLYFDFLTILC